ncbi:MAG: class I SAM-dependent methyltransferase [Lewinellaceae bacterium]|nr:class I SAM-dependent methyltransferase [Lewinellaceae bacterium]
MEVPSSNASDFPGFKNLESLYSTRTKIENETIQAWDSVAELYQTNFMDLDLYNDTYDAFCRRIEKPGAKILELGCGPGNITRYLLRKRPDFDILATDAAPNMVKLARENNPAARCEVLDCREMDRLDGPFDGIVCGFCLPYLSKEEVTKLLHDCSNLLNDDGTLYFSAIEGDYNRSGYETSSDRKTTMYVYYHQEDYLLEGLQANGFAHIDVIRKPYTKGDGSASVHLIVAAQKNQA